jgi:hypothetical protein
MSFTKIGILSKSMGYIKLVKAFQHNPTESVISIILMRELAKVLYYGIPFYEGRLVKNGSSHGYN